MPQHAWERAADACMNCDILLVVGTSASVYPAAGLIRIAKDAGASIVVVNKDAGEASILADVELLGLAGEVVPQLLEADGNPA